MRLDQLPDDALAACLRRVPNDGLDLGFSFLSFSSRGGVEQVCRRWRRVAFTFLPWEARLNFYVLQKSDEESDVALSRLERALQILAGRHITDLSLLGCCQLELAMTTATAALAAAMLPLLRHLYLDGSGLLRVTALLASCRVLQSLEVTLPMNFTETEEEVLVHHLSALPLPLQQLSLGRASARLLQLLQQAAPAHHVQIFPRQGAYNTFLFCPWSLEEFTVQAIMRLELHPKAGRQSLLTAIWSGPPLLPAGSTQVLSLPYLPMLAHLRRLRCVGRGSVPPQIWNCGHLQRLVCTYARFPALPSTMHTQGPAAAAAAAGVQFGSSLRSLQLESCRFAGGASTLSLLLPALTHLTRLSLSHCLPATGLPASISTLSALRQLRLNGDWLGRQGVAPLAHMTSLTALFLPNCQLTKLAPGPYLSGLKMLDISGNDFGQPLPFEATAATQLTQLIISACGAVAGERVGRGGWECLGPQYWEGLEAKLNFLRNLEVLRLVALCEEADLEVGELELATLIADRFGAQFEALFACVKWADFLTDTELGMEVHEWDEVGGG